MTLSNLDLAWLLHQQTLGNNSFLWKVENLAFEVFQRSVYVYDGKGWATRFKNSTYTCLGLALYVIHSGGMLIANFYVGLFMHVFLVFSNIIHCHI